MEFDVMNILMDIAVILLATKLLGMLTRKLGLPQVVGMILAGLLIGPAIFSKLNLGGFQGLIHPTEAEMDVLQSFSQVGVVFILFSSGLETDFGELKKSGLAATAIACAGVIVPIALGTIGALCFMGGFGAAADSDKLLNALFVGCILAATSVGITVETLRELGKLSTRVGTTVLSAAIIDDVIGILNTRDFLLNAQSSHPKTVRELLRSAYLVPETVPADTLFSNMKTQKIHLAVVVDEYAVFVAENTPANTLFYKMKMTREYFAVVVDEYGGMSGIVTMEDLLEEIVGNIYDEFDPSEENEIEQLGENLWRVDGSVDLDTLSDALHVELPLEEEYDTLGGMGFSTFSSIPEDGSTPLVEINGLKIQVEKICDHRVESALVSKLEPKPVQEEEQEEE